MRFKTSPQPTRYAQNAIENLMDTLRLGGHKTDIYIFLPVVANVLKTENATTADKLIFSIFEIIERKKNILGRKLKTHSKIDFAFGECYFYAWR